MLSHYAEMLQPCPPAEPRLRLLRSTSPTSLSRTVIVNPLQALAKVRIPSGISNGTTGSRFSVTRVRYYGRIRTDWGSGEVALLGEEVVHSTVGHRCA